MIEDGNLEELTGLCQLFGKAHIGMAGAQVARWVIVDEDDAAGEIFEGRFKNDLRVGNGTGYSTMAYLPFFDDLIIAAEHDDPKLL